MAKMILEVPEDIRKVFKIECLKNDTSMKDAIVEFMKEYAKKRGNAKKEKEINSGKYQRGNSDRSLADHALGAHDWLRRL